MSAYYNEIDPVAAQWLRNLIAAGLIAPGDVDERSIEDVRPTELVGYTQCHFFAGIGVWSYALRRAGWPDDRSVWTGSCPCQPFSAAGEGKGFADERHLWPAFYHLIVQRRPATILGEQVASSDADPWIDLVCADLERLGYAFGATPFPAASVGCPGIRDRLYWVADASGTRPQRQRGEPGEQQQAREPGPSQGGTVGILADTSGRGLGELWRALEPGNFRHLDGGGDALGVLGDAGGAGLPLCEQPAMVGAGRRQEGRAVEQSGGAPVGARRPGPVNGFWRDADWLRCRDGRWRPVEPGTFPLAARAPGDVGQLRAYGNGLNAEAARIFIEILMS